MSSAQTRHDLYNLAGREVAALIQDGFTAESDPYGRGWKPSAAANREGRRTLRETGALQDGIKWKADSRGLLLSTSGSANNYAVYHQKGTRRLPKRQFMPDPGELPPIYRQEVGKVFNAYFLERYG